MTTVKKEIASNLVFSHRESKILDQYLFDLFGSAYFFRGEYERHNYGSEEKLVRIYVEVPSSYNSYMGTFVSKYIKDLTFADFISEINKKVGEQLKDNKEVINRLTKTNSRFEEAKLMSEEQSMQAELKELKTLICKQEQEFVEKFGKHP